MEEGRAVEDGGLDEIAEGAILLFVVFELRYLRGYGYCFDGAWMMYTQFGEDMTSVINLSSTSSGT
jgi:hypothetical protein